MIRLTYPKGGEVWVNPEHIRSLVDGGVEYTGNHGDDVRRKVAGTELHTTRIRFIQQDGEIRVSGTPEEIVDQIHADQEGRRAVVVVER